jgi:uncharacterized protein YjlB
MVAPPVLRRWTHREGPNDELLEATLRREGLEPAWWSNGPGFHYAEHEHDYHKVIYCAEGSITFVLTPTGEELELYPGDRLDLPPGWPHSALVGTAGVRCVEAHR